MCISTFSTIFSTETTGQIEAKFHMEPPWDGRTKACSTGPGYMTKMAAMLILVQTLKNLLRNHKVDDDLQTSYAALDVWLLLSCSNDDPGLTLTYSMTKSNSVPYDFVWEKDKLIFSSPEPKADKGELIVYQWSVVVIVRFPHFQTWISLKPVGQSWSNFMVASLGWRKGCIIWVGERFWGRLDQNSGFHCNRKPPLTYNGENDVSTFSWLFLIRSFSYLQITRTCIKSPKSPNFGQIGPLTTELAALGRLKNFP